MSADEALLPRFIDVRGLSVAVTGDGGTSGEIAERLAGAGADVRRIGAGTPGAAAQGELSQLGSPALVLSAGEEHAELADAARRRGIPVVAAGGGPAPLHLVGISEPDGIVVAVSLAAHSVGLAELVSRALTPENGRLAEILVGLRGRLEERFPDVERRAAIWRDILDSPVRALLAAGSDDDAQELAERMAWGTG